MQRTCRHPLARVSVLHRGEPRRHHPWQRPTWRPAESAAGTDPLARGAQIARLEAVLFAADEPLPLRRLAQALSLDDTPSVRELLVALQALYDADQSAFQVEEVAGGFKLLTRPEYHPWIARLRKGTVPEPKLSSAARETLTIVAYRQPITRADLEGVRGVQSGDVLRQLMERGLIRIAGRDTSLGRPVLYGTTKKFLQLYGLRSLRDLPVIPDLNRPE